MDMLTDIPRSRPHRANFITEFDGLCLDWLIVDDPDDELEITLLTRANLSKEELRDAIADCERDWEAANE